MISSWLPSRLCGHHRLLRSAPGPTAQACPAKWWNLQLSQSQEQHCHGVQKNQGHRGRCSPNTDDAELHWARSDTNLRLEETMFGLPASTLLGSSSLNRLRDTAPFGATIQQRCDTPGRKTTVLLRDLHACLCEGKHMKPPKEMLVKGMTCGLHQALTVCLGSALGMI